MKFYYGAEGFLINQEINRAVRELGVEPTIYSNDEPLEDIMLDISTISMFSEEKLIIIKNHSKLNSNDISDEFYDAVVNSEVEMIFSIEVEKLNKKNKLVEYLIKNADSKEFKALEAKNVIATIKKIVETKNGTISNTALLKLSSKLPVDLRIIISEVEKLLMESSDITTEMVDKSIGKYLSNDYFAFSNAIVSQDARGIIDAYQNKVEAGEEFTMIISQISTAFSLSLLVNSYKKKGYSNKEISDEKKIHIFRIKKASELLSQTSPLVIKELIVSLSDLDSDIKSGKVDPKNGIEHYLLKLIK